MTASPAGRIRKTSNHPGGGIRNLGMGRASFSVPTSQFGSGLFAANAMVSVWLLNDEEFPSVTAYAIWTQTVGTEGLP